MGTTVSELTITPVTTVDGIKEFFDFANPYLLGKEPDLNDPFMLEHYTPEHILRLITEGRRALFIIRAERTVGTQFQAVQDGEIIAGAMTKLYEDVDRTLRQITDPGPHVGLEYWVVREDYRRRGLTTRLVHRSYDWARERGVSKLVVETELTRPASLFLSFKEGFVATHLLPPSLGVPDPFMILRKTLS